MGRIQSRCLGRVSTTIVRGRFYHNHVRFCKIGCILKSRRLANLIYKMNLIADKI